MYCIMVKKNTNRKKKGGAGKPAGKRLVKTVMAVRKGGLDSAAAAYARLLKDPCNAALVHPTYYGTTGGYVARFVTDFTVLTATDTYLNIFWAPSAIGSNSTGMAASSTATAGVVGDLAGSKVPGHSFITGSMVSKYRAVAACIQIMWNDTELNRAGQISLGNGPTIIGTPTITGDSLATQLPNQTRIPEDMSEIIWRPSNADMNFRDPSATQTDDLTECSSLLAAIRVPTGTAGRVRVRCTAVYEWVPEFGSGLSVPTTSTNKSSNTLNDVVNALDSTGNWMFKASNAIGSFAAGAYRLGRAAAPLIGGARRAMPLLLGM